MIIPQYMEIFFDFVEKDHEKHNALARGGHDFLHACRVAQSAWIISEKYSTKVCAWIAGMLHNTDRFYSEKEIPNFLKRALSLTPFHSQSLESTMIIESILNHHKPNDENDNEVTIVLKDADRISDLEIIQIIRSAQFHPHSFIYDPENPSHVVDTSKDFSSSLFTNIHRVLEWEHDPKMQLRNPKAIEMAKPGFIFLKQALNDFERQLALLSMW